MLESLAQKSKHSPPACREIKASPFFSLPFPPDDWDFAVTRFNLIRSEKIIINLLNCLKQLSFTKYKQVSTHLYLYDQLNIN